MKLKWIISLCLFLAVTASAKTRKTVFVIIDGVPADMIERLNTPAIDEIASRGSFSRAYTGGEIGGYSQTPTISAIGYTNLLTATWLNKHNVDGNSNLKPNYNYWTIFRIAKEQKKDYKTAIYSSWTDNRTVLLGEGKPETNHLKIDYVHDGYDLDTKRFPKKDKDLHIFDIDEQITNGQFFDDYTLKADQQIAQIWEAVKYREERFDEEWLVIITTDHGRTENGHDHGGQSERERTTWIATNQEVNRHFHDGQLAITDITPSICRFMGFQVPQAVLWEQDGMPFIGPVDIADLKSSPYDNDMILSWRCLNQNAKATIYMATDNLYKTGGEDKWIPLATVPASEGEYRIKSDQLPESKFYKFVVRTDNNHLNRWVIK